LITTMQHSIAYDQINRLFFSHMLRTLEAYEIVTVWRAEELARNCVNSLNTELTIPAAVSARSLVELALRYLLAARNTRHYLGQVPWDQFQTGAIVPKIPIDDKRDEPLEDYIERLLWGSRLRDRVKMFPGLEEQTILKQIDAFDKIAKTVGQPYSVRNDYYEFLCEIAHPNYVGNGRYVEKKSPNGDWEVYSMSAHARGGDYTYITVKTCGALSISLECATNGFAIFQETKKNIISHIGSILP